MGHELTKKTFCSTMETFCTTKMNYLEVTLEYTNNLEDFNYLT